MRVGGGGLGYHGEGMGRAQVWSGPSDTQATHWARNSVHPQPSGQRTGIHPFLGGDSPVCMFKLPGLPKAYLGAQRPRALYRMDSALTGPAPSTCSSFIHPLVLSSIHLHRHQQQPQQLQQTQTHRPCPCPSTLHHLPHTSTSQRNCKLSFQESWNHVSLRLELHLEPEVKLKGEMQERT